MRVQSGFVGIEAIFVQRSCTHDAKRVQVAVLLDEFSLPILDGGSSSHVAAHSRRSPLATKDLEGAAGLSEGDLDGVQVGGEREFRPHRHGEDG